jgi:hypothetical protein
MLNCKYADTYSRMLRDGLQAEEEKEEAEELIFNGFLK